MSSESKTKVSCDVKPFKNITEAYYDFEEDLMNEVEEDYLVEEEYMEERVDELYKLPLFDGKAGITVRARLPAKRFDIWAEISAVCVNGTLVSASGERDHLWLGFVGEKGVLRWDAGSGPLELRTGKVKTDGRTKITARRYKKDAMLRLGTSTASGTAQGRMSSLDVDPFIHVGYSHENVLRSPGISVAGFVGCVHRLRVSGRDIIPPAHGVTMTSQGLRPCTPSNLATLVCP